MNLKKESAPESDPKQETLLVVDDDPSVREVLTRVLDEEGYFVLTAANGPQALEMMAKHQIDLVLLDLNMPLESGWETLETLIAQNPLAAVIVVTARSGQLFTALGSGVGALLEKPLDYSKLLETVRSMLGESTQERLDRLAGRQMEFRYVSSRTKSVQS